MQLRHFPLAPFYRSAQIPVPKSNMTYAVDVKNKAIFKHNERIDS